MYFAPSDFYSTKSIHQFKEDPKIQHVNMKINALKKGVLSPVTHKKIDK